jgi:hypothetical protein
VRSELPEQLVFGASADDPLDRLTGPEEEQRGDAHHLVAQGELRFVIDVHSGDSKPPAHSIDSSLSIGSMILHGPHHSAQKSTTWYAGGRFRYVREIHQPSAIPLTHLSVLDVDLDPGHGRKPHTRLRIEHGGGL